MNMRAIVIKTDPWLKVKIALFWVALCILAVLIISWIPKSGLAENMKCPPGNKTCFVAVHRQTHKETCRHSSNPPWEWKLDEQGNKIPCSEEISTKTPGPIIITYTPVVKTIVLTNTPFSPPPTDKPHPSPTRRPFNEDSIFTPTPTCTPSPVIEECPMCEISWIIAHSQQTMAAGMATLAVNR